MSPPTNEPIQEHIVYEEEEDEDMPILSNDDEVYRFILNEYFFRSNIEENPAEDNDNDNDHDYTHDFELTTNQELILSDSFIENIEVNDNNLDLSNFSFILEIMNNQ